MSTDPWELVRDGRYLQAAALLRAEAEAAEADFGPDAFETAVAWNRVGIACKFAARYDEAADAYARALPVAEALADDEPALLASLLHNLGGLAHARRLFDQAESHAQRGLRIREHAGGDPCDLAADLAALAAINEGQERWADAEANYRRALQIWEDDGDRYEIAMTLNGLAAVVRFGGRPDEAEPLFERALRLMADERGEDNPDTATIRNNLAMLLNATGRAPRALPLLERAAADLLARLGEDHPATRDVAANRDRIAAALRDVEGS